MFDGRWLGSMVLAVVLTGCGHTDSEFDSLVDEIWIDQNEGQLVPAVEYLKGDGWHYDGTGETTVDLDIVVPMCEEIEQKYNAKCYGILYDDDSAGEFITEVLVRLSLSSDRSGIRNAIAAADAKFEGDVTQQWGSAKWLAISFESSRDE